MVVCYPAGFGLLFAGDARRESVRWVGVAELVAQEVGELFGSLGAHGKAEPAVSIGAQPDADASTDEASDGE